VPVYMVERYLPDLTADGVRAQIEREKELVGLRHLRTTYLPDDELCFSLFEAPSLAAVSQANELTGMAYERISPAFDGADEEVS
jgi:Protein of unknown function (DUF4242)